MSVNINTPRVGMEIDITPIVETLNFMYSAAKAIDPSTTAGKKVSYASVERVSAAIEEDLYQEALKRKEEIAHVFDWASVIDHTPATRKKNTMTARGQGSMRRTPGSVGTPDAASSYAFHDTNARFIPKIRPKSPLFRLNLQKKGGSHIAKIGFLPPSVTDYDPIVKNVAASSASKPASRHKKGFTRKTKPWGRHHFKDQATNLELVSVIEKRSNPVSSRRLSGSSPGNGRNGRRIIQAFVGSGTDANLQFFGTYTRQNAYKGKFTRFFLQYASSKADRQAQVTLDKVQKDINKVYQNVVRNDLAGRHAAALMKASAGMAVGPTGQLRVKPLRMTYYGREVPSLPALQDKMSTKLMQNILQQFKRSAQNDSMPFSKMSGRVGSSEKAARMEANQAGAAL
jgi:hypothetical protein